MESATLRRSAGTSSCPVPAGLAWEASVGGPDPVPQRLGVHAQISSDRLDRRSRPRPVQRHRVRLELGGVVLHPHRDSVLLDHQDPSLSGVQTPGSGPEGGRHGTAHTPGDERAATRPETNAGRDHRVSGRQLGAVLVALWSERGPGHTVAEGPPAPGTAPGYQSSPLPYGLVRISRLCPLGSSKYAPRPPSLWLISPGWW